MSASFAFPQALKQKPEAKVFHFPNVDSVHFCSRENARLATLVTDRGESR